MINIILGEYTGLVEILNRRAVKIQGKKLSARKEEDNQKSTILQKPRKCHQGIKIELYQDASALVTFALPILESENRDLK